MSGSDGFLNRWSRRKQAAARPTTPEAVPEPPDLPALDDLGATSDYAAFLQKGVAAVVQQAALQKAWTTDAAIAGFRGMADYDWDFNAAGYGRLRVTDNVVALLKAVLGSPEPDAADPPPEPVPVEAQSVRQTPPPEPLAAPLPDPVLEAEQPDHPPADAAAPRRHGTAMPS